MKIDNELREVLMDIVQHPWRSVCELLGICLTFVAIIAFFSIW